MENENPYIPFPAKVTDVTQEYSQIKTFTLRFENEDKQSEFTYDPGQFLQVTVQGVGEAPISINSSPTCEGCFKLCIEKKGRVTSAMWDLERGSRLFVRGPYGNGFPMDEIKGKDVLCIAGGIGLAPLRSAIDYLLDNREEHGDVQILYGDKTPECLLFDRIYPEWDEEFDLNIICEEGTGEWTGDEGMVTDLLDLVHLDPEESVVITCGPPIMYKFLIPEIQDIGFGNEQIYVSLERRMECGLGKCRRCNVGDLFVCQDGPVFSFDEIEDYFDKET
ncbi:MAG: FAD/NAD(P)-binding protein [Candidatus Hadarchaeia archaeon]